MKYWLFLSNKFSFPYELKVSSFLYYSICTIWKERIRCSFYCKPYDYLWLRKQFHFYNRWTCFFKYFAWTFLKICSLPNTNKKKKKTYVPTLPIWPGDSQFYTFSPDLPMNVITSQYQLRSEVYQMLIFLFECWMIKKLP